MAFPSAAIITLARCWDETRRMSYELWVRVVRVVRVGYFKPCELGARSYLQSLRAGCVCVCVCVCGDHSPWHIHSLDVVMYRHRRFWLSSCQSDNTADRLVFKFSRPESRVESLAWLNYCCLSSSTIILYRPTITARSTLYMLCIVTQVTRSSFKTAKIRITQITQYTLPHDSSFPTPKVLASSSTGYIPKGGRRQIRVG